MVLVFTKLLKLDDDRVSLLFSFISFRLSIHPAYKNTILMPMPGSAGEC